MPAPHIHSIFIGQPKTITDAQGTWRSSIFRDPVHAPVQVHLRGLEGDRVTQPYHGGPDSAICAHLLDHYRYWNRHFSMALGPGSVGENFTLEGIKEKEVCAGDIIQAGTARLQVSGPRIPCANLARRIGRADWVRLTVTKNRTGFYLRVLEPGVVQPGDAWILAERLNPKGSISALNRAMYLGYNRRYTRLIQKMEGLGDWWKEQALERLENRRDHWSAEMKR